MSARVKISIADCLVAVIIAALFLLPLWLPHVPMFVQMPVVILVILLGLFLAASALRNRWRLSKSAGQNLPKTTGLFFGYYFRLVAAAIAIIVVFLLLMLVIVR